MEWIKTIEEPPEEGVYMLLYSDVHDYVFIGYFDSRISKFWSLDAVSYEVSDITHWMDYPQPPKK